MEIEGIRYSGSKAKIIPEIEKILNEIKFSSVLDAFSGSTRVSQFFKLKEKTVIANDLAIYSKIFASCYLLSRIEKKVIKEKIDYLNSLKPEFGWFSDNYGGTNNNGSSVQQDGKKKLWQIHNTMKLDAIRPEIDSISENEIEKSILITSLILALDKVDNTLGHQVAFLKDWSPRSFLNLELKVPGYFIDDKEHKVLQKDCFELKDKVDLCYLDPPYGTSNKKTLTTRVRYASYYNVWTTVVKNDRPIVLGASNRREEFASDKNPGAISVFESTKLDEVVEAFRKLFNTINTKYFLLSYNNKSKVPIDLLINLIEEKHKILAVRQIEHSENVQAKLTSNENWKNEDFKNKNFEFLFLFSK